MSIIEDAKSVVKLVQQIDNIELYGKILDLQGQIFELVDQNRKLKVDIDSLQEKLKTKAALKFEHNAYWKILQDGSREGPFCSRCWDVASNVVRMLQEPGSQYHECPNCRSPLNTSGKTYESVTVVTRETDPWS